MITTPIRINLLLAILFLYGCIQEKNDLTTKLEEFVLNADESKSTSYLFNQINDSIFKRVKIKTFKNDKNGKLREVTHYSFRMTEYKSEKQAAQAFYEKVEFAACCVPDDDIIKLKNFEDLKIFKNGRSSTTLSENLVIITLDKHNGSSLKVLDNILKERLFLRLDVRRGGPAIWTLNKTNKL